MSWIIRLFIRRKIKDSDIVDLDGRKIWDKSIGLTKLRHEVLTDLTVPDVDTEYSHTLGTTPSYVVVARV